VYHARHLEVYDTSDKILNLTALGGAVVLSAAVLGRELIMDPGPNPPTDPPPSDGR
jgi:hypothetical protein